MIVSCPSCEERYKFSEAKLGKRGAKITCPKCRHVFVVYKDRQTESLGRKAEDGTITADERETAQPPPSRDPWPRDFPTWSFRELGATWRVRKQQGLTYEFYSLEELDGFLEERQVSRRDEISVDGRDWRAIDGFSNLTAYFYDVWKRIESGDIELDDDEEEEDEADAPTTIMGAASSLADEIRRAVQDAKTPAPAANRIASTPRAATPRGPSPRQRASSPVDEPSDWVAPPAPQPSWGGPDLTPEPPSRAKSWTPPTSEPEPPAPPKLPPRPERSAVEKGKPVTFGNSGNRAYGSTVPLPPAGSGPSSAPPPHASLDPFSAIANEARADVEPAVGAAPPPKKKTAARADGGGGGAGMLIVAIVVLAVLAAGGLLGALKLGVIPASVLPIDLPAALLPADAPVTPSVEPEAADGEATPADGEAPSEDAVPPEGDK